jgi:hypothetical protein
MNLFEQTSFNPFSIKCSFEKYKDEEEEEK